MDGLIVIMAVFTIIMNTIINTYNNVFFLIVKAYKCFIKPNNISFIITYLYTLFLAFEEFEKL
jgi:hypothetical protein